MNSGTAGTNNMESHVQIGGTGLSEDGSEARVKCNVCTLDLVDCESYCFRKAKESEAKVDETNKKLAGLKKELDCCKREMELAKAKKQEWVEKYEACVRRVNLGKALEKMTKGEDAIQCVELGKRMQEKLEKQDYAGAIKTVIDYANESSAQTSAKGAQELKPSGSKNSATATGSVSQETKRKRKRATTSAYSQSFIDLLVNWPPTVDEIRQQRRKVERSGEFSAKSPVKPAAKKQQP